MADNKGLVNHAKKALAEKWGYVWGTFGQILTEALYEQKLRQYPTIKYYDNFIRSHWIGKRSVDCVGLIKSYYWSESGELKYNGSTDVSADGMFNKAVEKGTIDTIPEIIGLCVWKKGHIGIYIGNGQVIEAHGTKYGVIQTPLHGTGATAWTHWLKCPFITYVLEQPSPAQTGGIAFNPLALELQKALNAAGYTDNEGRKLDEDGKPGTLTSEALSKVALGPGTKNAVVGWAQKQLRITVDNAYGRPPKYHETYDAVGNWQSKKGLKVDHVIGIQTLLSLL